MKKLTVAALLCSAFAMGAASPVLAAKCADRAHVVEQLKSRFGETLAYTGMGRNSHIVEVYASKSTSRWTLTVATPDGLSCVLSTGRGAESLASLLGSNVLTASN